MEDKNLNANQSIELIQQMIRGTRRRLSFGSSNLFLLWGYLLAATAIGIFVLLKTTDCRAWQWLWLAAGSSRGHSDPVAQQVPRPAGQKLHRPAAGTDMGLHSGH